MAVSAQRSDHFTYGLAMKLINLSSDTIKVILMRSGFVFNQGVHLTKANIKATSASIPTITIAASPTNTITRSTGSFLTDGMVVGNAIKINGSTLNTGIYTIKSITATVITTNEALVAETVSTNTVSSNDELGFLADGASLNGYTAYTQTTGAVTVAEDDVNHYTTATFPTVAWTASGGSIGPTGNALLIDDTTADKTIIGCFVFGADQTATTGTQLTISNGAIRVL